MEKPISSFRRRSAPLQHLLQSNCNTCRYEQHFAWVKANQQRVKEYRTKDKWTLVKRCSRRGISPEILIKAFEDQNGKCAICSCSILISDSAIDHNHKTGEFRGVLCKTCNRALGMFRDSPEILMSAVNYLSQRGSYNSSNEAPTEVTR